MTPINYFNSTWERCDEISALHTFLSSHLTAALNPDELLRSEWVARVSCLDLFIHEKIAQGMLGIFSGSKPATQAFLNFQITNDLLMQQNSAASATAKGAAFDLFVRDKLSLSTFQAPEKIADGIRLISEAELWNEIALHQGASPVTKKAAAKSLKSSLSLIIDRRNKIAHEGDLQPTTPRTPWPILKSDLTYVNSFIKNLVSAIDVVVP